MRPRFRQITPLQPPLAKVAAYESKLKNEIEALKTSLAHALSSEREMRAAARDMRDEWERAERALLEEIGALRKCLKDTKKALASAKKELEGKQVIRFIQRLIQGKRGSVEEMITLDEPPQIVCAKAEEECVLSLSGWGPWDSLLRLDPWRTPPKSKSYSMD